MSDIDALGPYELGESGEENAISRLIGFLSYGTDNEKRLTASAIEKLTPKYPDRCQEAVPFLLANLKNPGNQVRQYTLKALLGLKVPSETSGLLTNIATDDVADYNRKLATRILQLQRGVEVPTRTKPSKEALPEPKLTIPMAKSPAGVPRWMVNKALRAFEVRGIRKKMTQEDILILAITRMHSGLCLAGIRLETRQWVRPIKSYGTLQSDDLIDANGRQINSFDVVKMNLLSWHPDKPHVEDWITDSQREKPVILRNVPEFQRVELLDSLLDTSPNEVLQAFPSRSLCLIKPNEIKEVIFDPGVRYGKHEARISFNFGGQDYLGTPKSPGLPCTDLKFRTWGRMLLGGSPNMIKVLSGEQLKELLYLEKVYLTIGLGREYKGKHWPMIIGFHTIPDYITDIDFNSP